MTKKIKKKNVPSKIFLKILNIFGAKLKEDLNYLIKIDILKRIETTQMKKKIPKEISGILNKQLKSVFTNTKSNKRIENVHTFFEAESLRSTKIGDISSTEEDIEEILSI